MYHTRWNVLSVLKLGGVFEKNSYVSVRSCTRPGANEHENQSNGKKNRFTFQVANKLRGGPVARSPWKRNAIGTVRLARGKVAVTPGNAKPETVADF